MNREPEDLLDQLAQLERERRVIDVEWEGVLAGTHDPEVVAQHMRERGISEEEIARARELFTPTTPEFDEALAAKLVAANEPPRSSGGVEPIVAEPRSWRSLTKEVPVSLTLILFVVLLVLVVAAIPAWPYSRGWGYNPAGILVFILVLLLVLKLLHKI